MPKKSTKPAKLRPDVAETAFRVMQEATGQKPNTVPGQGPKNSAAVERGARGGKSRAANLTGKELAEIGKKGAKARCKDGPSDA